MKYQQVYVFHAEGFQQPVTSENDKQMYFYVFAEVL